MLAFRNVCTGKRKSDLLFVIPRGDLLDAYCIAVLDPGVKCKVDFPQIGFEKGTTERGVSKVSKSV